MTKKCSRCNKTKNQEEFRKHKRNIDGLHIWCKTCCREYDRDWYKKTGGPTPKRLSQIRRWRQNRTEEFNNRYKSHPCADCRQIYHPAAMQFDHLGDKKFNLGDMKTQLSWEELDKEIEKCELVCANCHAVRTWKRKHNK